MSLSAGLPTNLDSHPHENDLHSQHLLQPDTAYWLTLESPIARAISIGTCFQARPSLTSCATVSALRLRESNHSLEDNLTAPLGDTPSDNPQLGNSLSHLHLSELENCYGEFPTTLSWSQTNPDHMSFGPSYSTRNFQHIPTYVKSEYPDSINLHGPSSPYSSPSLFDNSPIQSPYLSSPELHTARYAARAPRSSPNDHYELDDEEEDVTDGKPYARLIYEALLQAPGHRMMLRDIYEWFEKNTGKPRESGSNGWQNSIRHNLSMNKAFENDKTRSTNARGVPKKATSVWFLTQDAIVHGVQSTTRYRKTGGVRKTGLSGSPDYRRQRSGAKGGRAARKAARLRRLEQSSHSTWAPAITPDDVGPFNSLVHAANYINDYSAYYDSNPPTPSESFPYTPKSPVQRTECAIEQISGGKLASMDTAPDELRGQDFLFQHSFDAGLDDPW